MKQRRKITHWALLLLLVTIWGGSFVAIKIAITDIGPAWLAATRLFIATLLMILFARARGIRRPTGAHEWHIALVLGIIGTTLPFALIGWASYFVPSGIAGLMMATNPMLVLILSLTFLPEESPTWPQILGLIVGFLGVAMVILGRSAAVQMQVENIQLDTSLIAYGALLLGALGYAINNVLSRRTTSIPHATLGYGALLTATPAALLIAALSEPFPDISGFKTDSYIAIIFLAVLPTWIATLLLYKLIAQTSSGFVALSNYLVPATAIILGAILLSEQLAPLQYLGFAMILLGIAVSQGLLKAPRSAKSSSAK